VSQKSVIDAGASNLSSLTTDLPMHGLIRECWSNAVHVVFILALVTSSRSIPFACLIENFSVHKVAKERKDEAGKGY
jgi:hypothetical protein